MIASGMWIYTFAVTTWSSQNDIRTAQLLRDDMVRNHLANVSDAQAFAATDDPMFIRRYMRHSQAFESIHARLAAKLLLIDPQYEQAPLVREERIFHTWQREVAGPIFARKQSRVRVLLTQTGPQLSKAFLAADADIDGFLDSAVVAAEDRRGQLLKRLIIARLALVVISITLIIGVLWSRERAKHVRALQNAEYLEQRRIATLLQQSIAPTVLPHIRAVGLDAVYYPAARKNLVGGDWYDVFELGGERLLIIIGDVTGHGLDAALMMVRARQSIISAALVENDPARILERANGVLVDLFGRMITVLCAVVNTETREFTYATAGHPPPVVAAPGRAAQLLPTGGLPLGLFADFHMRSESNILEPGSCVYLYTDGLVENTRDVLAGEEALLRAATVACGSAQPARMLYEEAGVGESPKDDVAILAITVA